MRVIEIENWPRKPVYEHFLKFEQPHITACVQFDITNAHTFCKENDIPFFRFALFAALHAANNITELRYRIRGNSVVEHEKIRCSFTVQTAQNQIGFAWADLSDHLPEFLSEIEKESERIENGIEYPGNHNSDDVIFLGCVPWSAFTCLSHPMKDSYDSIPRMTWGRYISDVDRLKMPMSATVHHSLVDGYHLGQFEKFFQHYLNNPLELT